MTKYILLCNYCNWKHISDLKNTDIHELKNDSLSNRKFRCKNCGRAVVPRKIEDPQKDLEKKQEDEKVKKENKKWIEEYTDFQINFLKEESDD